ncbi:MAG: hypothetical protein ABI082_03620, partial [Dokdonella sp.]
RVDRAVIANGGSTIHADAYTMPATFGQPTAGALCASSYQLYDGFWGVAGSVDLIFANGFDP